MRESLKIVIELLAAIPSVVWGFVGLTIISRLITDLTGAPVGVNILNGGIILALRFLRRPSVEGFLCGGLVAAFAFGLVLMSLRV